jgi:hypothetical protein
VCIVKKDNPRKLYEVLRASAEAEVLFGGSCPEGGARWDEYQDRIDAGHQALDALAAELPMQPRGLSDAAALAEIARHWADEELDGSMSYLRDDADRFEYFAARLVVAVMALGGRPV